MYEYTRQRKYKIFMLFAPKLVRHGAAVYLVLPYIMIIVKDDKKKKKQIILQRIFINQILYKYT